MDISWKQNNQIGSISFREDTKQSDKKKETIKCRDIIEFCNNFPNIDGEDIFSLEDEIDLKSSLNNYFQIVYNHMEKEPMFSEYNEEEKKILKDK